jgi:hypothetical protein
MQIEHEYRHTVLCDTNVVEKQFYGIQHNPSLKVLYIDKWASNQTYIIYVYIKPITIE